MSECVFYNAPMKINALKKIIFIAHVITNIRIIIAFLGL